MMSVAVQDGPDHVVRDVVCDIELQKNELHKGAAPARAGDVFEKLAVAGRISEIRSLPDSIFSDSDRTAEAASEAALHGRMRVLRHLCDRGVQIDLDAMLDVGIRNDRVGTLGFVEAMGMTTCTPETLRLALRHDSACILGNWIDRGLVTSVLATAYEAVNYDAIYCFRRLESLPEVQRNAQLSNHIRNHGKPRVRHHVMSVALSAQLAARPQYSYRTPSAHIDLDKTTILFLLYRRAMRMLFLRGKS